MFGVSIHTSAIKAKYERFAPSLLSCWSHAFRHVETLLHCGGLRVRKYQFADGWEEDIKLSVSTAPMLLHMVLFPLKGLLGLSSDLRSPADIAFAEDRTSIP